MTSREEARDALVALFLTKLVGAGLPVKTVVGSKVTTLKGLCPLVAVLSAGTLRERATFMGTMPTVFLEVQVWMPQEQTGWTNAEAEDAMDEIEKLIAEVYQDNVGTANWSILENDGRSLVEEYAVDSLPYYMERIPTRVRLTKA